ncbi:ATP-grasp domain-containing protein [Actinorugispora endophytica]|uniref:ATP-grasp domain-containing protein n=1 Tax=Actinorugispora endophytica TaxID=1605990 RepID=A0A4R6V5Y7_9ACTN|nr:ATP-grasp domain-containing protein [Actinorugispora endophytica]TDQ54255.1 hypothetical protein EV190_10288 [Actinorugispora endophytica]
MASTVLYPCDPLRPHLVDAHFRGEAAAARDLGAATALLDHDALLRGDVDGAVGRVPADAGPLWYRGWMVPAPRYDALAAALASRGGALVVDAAAYRRAHELPGWYPLFAGATPRSVWCGAAPGEVPPAGLLAELVAPLGGGPGVVKDFVKSRKYEWEDACHVPDLRDAARLHRVVARMVELQGGFLDGGIVVRAFEEFTGAEARVWWVGGEPAAVGAHPDSPGERPVPDLRDVRPLVGALGHPFVTTDLALRADGRWRVVEVGDGQVSGLPATLGPEPVLSALLRA